MNNFYNEGDTLEDVLQKLAKEWKSLCEKDIDTLAGEKDKEKFKVLIVEGLNG